MYNFAQEKTIDVGFPLEDLKTLSMGDLSSPSNFEVSINGARVETESVKLNEDSYSDDWIGWQATFENGYTDMVVEYDIEATYGGYQSIYSYYLYYIFNYLHNSFYIMDHIRINFKYLSSDRQGFRYMFVFLKRIYPVFLSITQYITKTISYKM